MSPALPSTKTVSDGVLIKVRAAPGSSRDRVVGVHGDALKIAVRAPPEKGRANEAIAAALAQALELRSSDVRVQSGETSRDKWLLVAECTEADLLARLAALF